MNEKGLERARPFSKGGGDRRTVRKVGFKRYDGKTNDDYDDDDDEDNNDVIQYVRGK